MEVAVTVVDLTVVVVAVTVTVTDFVTVLVTVADSATIGKSANAALIVRNAILPNYKDFVQSRMTIRLNERVKGE